MNICRQFQKVRFKSYAQYIIEEKLKNQPLICKTEWLSIRENIIKNSPRTIESYVDSQVIRICGSKANAMWNVSSYVTCLTEANIPRNVAWINGMLSTYWQNRMNLRTEELQQINDMCIEIDRRRAENGNFLDKISAGQLVQGLSLMHMFREALEITNKYMDEHPNEQLKGSSVVIQRAFEEGELTLGFDLLRRLSRLRNFAMIEPDVFQSYCNYCQKDKTEIEKNMEIMLKFLQAECIIVSRKTVEEIAKTLSLVGRFVEYTEIDAKGQCDKCHSYLQEVTLTSDEYEQLRINLHDRVLYKKSDVYLESETNEINRFKAYLEKMGQFDWVIDALNTSFRFLRHKKENEAALIAHQANIITTTVKHLNNPNQRVLLIGRNSMSQWPLWNEIQNNCEHFFVHKEWKDDPFSLYAAFCQKPKANLLSEDKMRQHSFLLGSGQFRLLFLKWQQKHQFLITELRDDKKTIEIENLISKYRQFTHKNNGIWHVLFREDFVHEIKLDYLYTFPKSYACLQPSR